MRASTSAFVTAVLLGSLLGSAPARAAAGPGEAAPPLGLEKILQAPDGTVASWEALKGKAVVLEFWATWCGPCIVSIPHINGLVDKFQDQNVQFISITDEDESIVTPFLKKRPMKAWIGLDTDQSMLTAYEVYSIPHMVLVDSAGKISAVIHPAQLTEKVVQDLIAGRPVSVEE